MKQTVTILMALVAALLLASGFIVSGNVEMSRLITSREDELAVLHVKLTEYEQEIKRQAKDQQETEKTLKKTMEERDALNQQLNDALLSSQEANDAVAQQVQRSEQYALELESLTAEYTDLSRAFDALEHQLEQLSTAALQTSALHQQQADRDAQRIAELETELEEAIRPAAVPATQAPQATPVPERTPAPEGKKVLPPVL